MCRAIDDDVGEFELQFRLAGQTAHIFRLDYFAIHLGPSFGNNNTIPSEIGVEGGSKELTSLCLTGVQAVQHANEDQGSRRNHDLVGAAGGAAAGAGALLAAAAGADIAAKVMPSTSVKE